MHSESDLTIAGDRLDGIAAIATFRGELPHRTRWLILRGLIPVGKEGQRYVGSKRVLLRHWQETTRGATEAA